MSKLSKKQRADLREMFGGLCAYCGEELGARWHADHVEPVLRKSDYVKGKGFVTTGEVLYPDRDCISNMMPACAPCNINKHGSSLEYWRQQLEHGVSVLRNNYSTYRHAVRFGLVEETGRKVVFHFERVREKEQQAA